MLFILVPKPVDAWSGVFVVGGACGCVETCYGGRNMEGGCCGFYICVRVAFCHVHVDVWDMD